MLQCAWHPTTAELYYVSDAPGNYVLKKFDGTSSATVLDVGVDLGGSAPGWVFGQQGYSFLPDGAVAAAYPDRATGRSVLHVMAPDGTSVIYDKDDGLPHAFGGVAPAPDGSLYLLGGGPDTPSGIFHWDPATKVGTLSLIHI